MKTIVHMLRGGAPDKAMYQVGGPDGCDRYLTLHHNNTNLSDIPISIINEWTDKGHYIIPAEERDILFVNNHDSEIRNQDKILLPHSSNGHVMSYKHVPKDSDLYKNLYKHTGIHFPKSEVYSVEEFEQKCINENPVFKECVIKSSTGSGSRGVYVCSEYAVRQGWEGNYHTQATYQDLVHIIDYVKKYNDGNCKIKVEELIPMQYHKITIDFAIKNGKLLAYTWPDTYPDNFTFFWRNTTWKTKETDEWMRRVVEYLKSCDITDGCLDFEGFMNEDCSEVWICEFNFRHCGCYPDSMVWIDDKGEHFEFQKNYIEGTPMSQPYGKHRVVRVWNAILEQDIPDYGNGYQLTPIEKTV